MMLNEQRCQSIHSTSGSFVGLLGGSCSCQASSGALRGPSFLGACTVFLQMDRGVTAALQLPHLEHVTPSRSWK